MDWSRNHTKEARLRSKTATISRWRAIGSGHTADETLFELAVGSVATTNDGLNLRARNVARVRRIGIALDWIKALLSGNRTLLVLVLHTFRKTSKVIILMPPLGVYRAVMMLRGEPTEHLSRRSSWSELALLPYPLAPLLLSPLSLTATL